jgi:hypothetical protein
LCEQRDVEAQPAGLAIHRLFLGREEIEEKGGEAVGVQRGGHTLVSRASPTAAAAVGEDDERPCHGRQRQVTVENGLPHTDAQRRLCRVHAFG